MPHWITMNLTQIFETWPTSVRASGPTMPSSLEGHPFTSFLSEAMLNPLNPWLKFRRMFQPIHRNRYGWPMIFPSFWHFWHISPLEMARFPWFFPRRISASSTRKRKSWMRRSWPRPFSRRKRSRSSAGDSTEKWGKSMNISVFFRFFEHNGDIFWRVNLSGVSMSCEHPPFARQMIFPLQSPLTLGISHVWFWYFPTYPCGFSRWTEKKPAPVPSARPRMKVGTWSNKNGADCLE